MKLANWLRLKIKEIRNVALNPKQIEITAAFGRLIETSTNFDYRRILGDEDSEERYATLTRNLVREYENFQMRVPERTHTLLMQEFTDVQRNYERAKRYLES